MTAVNAPTARTAVTVITAKVVLIVHHVDAAMRAAVLVSTA